MVIEARWLSCTGPRSLTPAIAMSHAPEIANLIRAIIEDPLLAGAPCDTTSNKPNIDISSASKSSTVAYARRRRSEKSRNSQRILTTGVNMPNRVALPSLQFTCDGWGV